MMRSLPASEAVMKNIKMADAARGKDSHQSSKPNNLRLETEIALLRRQLLQATVENARKETLIESLENKLKDTGAQSKSGSKNHPNDSRGLSSEQQSPSGAGESSGDKKIHDIVDEIQRWLFVEGGNLRDVESLLSKYCELCRSIGIPLDRLFVSGMMMHPHTTACVWKWEVGCEFSQHMVPPEAFQPPGYNPDEPFAVLMEGRAMEYRMDSTTEEVPPGCEWFTNHGFQDYYALPLYHNGKFKGAMAWSTKSQKGFTQDQCEILKRSLTALSTVLRLYANDLVIDKAMMKLEEAVRIQTEQLATANGNLEHANRLIIQQSQKQLKHFAMMSHEIRTPLNCIVGISNLMMDSCEDEGMRESIEMITSSGDLLLAVVDDVLDYSKLAAGKVETRIEPTKLSFAVKTVETSIRTKAKSNHLELRTRVSPELPEYIVTDGRRLQQILYNLLGNAVKFGSEGKYVDFTISLLKNESDHEYIKFAIKDYGNGIAPNEMGNIFEPFRQLASNEPSHGGTGLGLAITRQLVKALGGTVSVKSDYGHWCEFSFSLPCAERDMESDAATLKSGFSRRGSDMSASSGYDFSDSETCGSLDASFTSSYGGVSTTSFQHVVDAAARQQVANMAGTQILAPQLKNGLHLGKSGSQTSSSLGSQTSFGIGRTESHSSMSNKQFVIPRPRSYGSVRKSASLGSFGKKARRVAVENGNNHFMSPSMRNKPFVGIIPETSAPAVDTPIPETASPKKRIPTSTPSSKRAGKKPEAAKSTTTAKASPKNASTSSSAGENDSEKKKINHPLAHLQVLIAEDNKINQKVLRRTLERLGIQDIEIVENGKMAVESSERKAFDIIFMDMQMPVMDGLEATSIISHRTSHPRIVFLTAHALSEYQEKALEAGGDGFISKPFKLDVIRGILDVLVEDMQVWDAAAAAEEEESTIEEEEDDEDDGEEEI